MQSNIHMLYPTQALYKVVQTKIYVYT